MSPVEVPRWDLSNLYPGLESEEFRQAAGRLGALLDDLDAYIASNQIARGAAIPLDPKGLAEVMSGYLNRMNAVLRLGGTLRSYVHSFVATDSYNTTARRIGSELEPLYVRASRQEVAFRGWVGRLAQDASLFEAALAEPGPAREHRFYLRETADQSRFLMNEVEEALAAELALSGANAWQRLQGVVTSQVKARFARDGEEEKEIAMTVLQNLRTDPREDVRWRAYEVEQAAWERVREPLAACLNGVKGAVVTLNKRRGRSDALHQPLDQSRIDRETLDAMLDAMRGSFPAFRRYWRKKAARLGKDALPWWDLFAPVGEAQKHISFGQARARIEAHLARLSPDVAAFAGRAFDERWIDAEPRAGKRGGAFCMSLPAVEESRILCNFDGSLEQVLTLAHELGHAHHNQCRSGKTELQRQTPMTLAETASIFQETLITDALLQQASRPEEELAILETLLIEAGQLVVDISSRYLFEKEVFERRARAELSADDFCEIMLRAQKETYGDGLDPRHLHPYMWAWKSHYYRPQLSFYNYPYAFGLLFGLGLYALWQQRGQSFVADYQELLRDTGEATPADLAARFGLDIRDRTFWEGSLQIIEQRIDRYLSL